MSEKRNGMWTRRAPSAPLRSGAGAKGRDERFMHDEPLVLLLLQRLPSRALEGVVLATPAARRFAPAGGDAALGFQAMQDWIEHPVGPDDLPARELAHALDDRIAVAFPLCQDRQHQRRRRGGHQVLGQLHDETRYIDLQCMASEIPLLFFP